MTFGLATGVSVLSMESASISLCSSGEPGHGVGSGGVASSLCCSGEPGHSVGSGSAASNGHGEPGHGVGSGGVASSLGSNGEPDHGVGSGGVASSLGSNGEPGEEVVSQACVIRDEEAMSGGGEASRVKLVSTCEAHLAKVCPNLSTRTCMFPPVFERGNQSPKEPASGAMPPKPSEVKAETGDDGEHTIFRVLEEFGRGEKQMAVFSKFKYKEFIKSVLDNNLPKDDIDHFLATLKKKNVAPQEAKDPQGQGNNDGEKESTPQETAKPTKKKEPDEMDFVVIHQNIGVILIEVKGGEKFTKSDYSRAKSQLRFGEKFIRGIGELLLPDVHIPVFKVIAMPKVRLHRTPASECIQEYIDLRSEHLGDFTSWWGKHFKDNFENGEISKGLLKLTAILLGQRTNIAAPAKVLTKVANNIVRQNFLRYNFDKQKIKQGPTCILKPAKGTVLAKHFTYVTPKQQAIWDGPRRQIFCGAPGSGKTILLQLKALECIEKKQTVIILVPHPLDSLYREVFKKNEGMYTIVCTQDQLRDQLREQANKSHIFVDEFQAFCDRSVAFTSVAFNQTAIPAVEFIGGKQADQFYRWISYDCRQIQFIGEECLFLSITALMKKYDFEHAYLATVMRNSLEVYEFVEKYYIMERSLFKSSSVLKSMSDFSDRSRTLGHQVSGPAVSIRTCDGVEDACELICSEVKEYAKEGDQCHYSRVAVLVPLKNGLVRMLKECLKGKNIPVCSTEDGTIENAVVVDLAANARSFEWLVVISVCLTLSERVGFYHNYLSFSRAVTKLTRLEITGY